MTSCALNLRTLLGYPLENIDCLLGFVDERCSRLWRRSLPVTRKIVIVFLAPIIFKPAFLNQEQVHGAF